MNCDTKTTCCRGAVLMLALLGGCRQPTSEDRNNQRVVESILTAITLQNSRLLEEDARTAKDRYDGGYLTDDEFQGIKAIIDKARHGDWSAAEEEGYRFREQHPFVRAGQ